MAALFLITHFRSQNCCVLQFTIMSDIDEHYRYLEGRRQLNEVAIPQLLSSLEGNEERMYILLENAVKYQIIIDSLLIISTEGWVKKPKDGVMM